MIHFLPCYEEILRTLASYDVVRFQTERDLWSFEDCLTHSEVGGALLSDDRVTVFGRTFRANIFPISIDVDACQSLVSENMEHSHVRRLAKSVGDRLDYNKGLELRFRAFEKFLMNHPEMRGRVSLLQIVPLTRVGMRTYDRIHEKLEQDSGNINGRFADIGWVPIRYLNKLYERSALMSLLRLVSVVLVTPIFDGMNFVTK